MSDYIEVGEIWEMSAGGKLIGVVCRVTHHEVKLRFSMSGGHSMHSVSIPALKSCYKKVSYD